MSLRNDCDFIIKEAIAHVLPDEAVQSALDGRYFSDGRLILISVGKAAWSMANAAHEILGNKIICHEIPVRPGRNLAIIVECAAINNRAKKTGYNAAKEFLERVNVNSASFKGMA